MIRVIFWCAVGAFACTENHTNPGERSIWPAVIMAIAFLNAFTHYAWGEGIWRWCFILPWRLVSGLVPSIRSQPAKDRSSLSAPANPPPSQRW